MPVSVTVDADFFQYYIRDAREPFDATLGDERHDGVLAPIGTGIQVGTGAKIAQPRLTITVYPDSAAIPAPSGVAAACDLDLPSGIVEVCGYDGAVAFRHDFGAPGRCRIQVEVSGRDQTDLFGAPPERHVISLAPAAEQAPRWRSAELDDVGRRLAAIDP